MDLAFAANLVDNDGLQAEIRAENALLDKSLAAMCLRRACRAPRELPV